MKQGFSSTGDFRIARAGDREFIFETFERDMVAALAVSPCSAIRMSACGVTFCGLIGPSHDPSVPAIAIQMRGAG